jgi:hypothetical protein
MKSVHVKKLLSVFFFSIAIFLILWVSGVFAPKPNWDGALAPDDPVQTVSDLPETWTVQNFTITPVANYKIEAVVLSTKKYAGIFTTGINDLVPYDFALGWGPLSVDEIISQISVSQSNRWYYFRWDTELPVDMRDIIEHSSNNHIVTSESSMESRLGEVAVYDMVIIEGYLVDITGPNGEKWTTSRSRGDTGSGSCEIIWVTSIEIGDEHTDF